VTLSPRERIVAGASAALVALLAFAGWSSATSAPPPAPEVPRAPMDPSPAAFSNESDIGIAGSARPAPVIEPESPVRPAPLVVHVSGRVRHPGVYALPAGSRLQRAIHVAGGFAAGAERDALNLAARLQDSDQVHVPSEADDSGRDAPAARPAGPVPGSTAAGDAGGRGRVLGKPVPSKTGARTAVAAKPEKFRKPGDGTVSINRGSAADLMRLPGVGASTAERILEARKAAGKFAAIDALADVKGIGPKRLERLRPFLTLD